ncbi:MAG: hypothetical protein ABL871_07865 [Terricaulis sp.]
MLREPKASALRSERRRAFRRGQDRKFEAPAGLARDLAYWLVQRFAIEGEHVLLPGGNVRRRALTRAGLSSRSATEPRLACLGPSGFRSLTRPNPKR